MINLGNYEEYFILYMDNELSAEQSRMVEDFVALHPHLAEELEILMSTKLPVDDVTFSGKEELLSSVMKLNVVDESLLLYIDDELPAAEKIKVEEQLKRDEAYNLQHSLLMKAKFDASEKILYPNKQELYRHTEKVVYFRTWMKIAVAVVIILSASLFFFINSNKNPDVGNVISVQPKPSQPTNPPAQKNIIAPVNNEPVIAKAPKQDKKEKQKDAVAFHRTTNKQEKVQQPKSDDVQEVIGNISRKEIAQLNTTKFTGKTKPDASFVLNNLVATSPVTTALNTRTTNDPIPEESIVTDRDERKIPAKGFLRKVSRLLERRTGIATVNADDELVIGAVALKLK